MPGKAKLVAERVDFGRDEAEVFGDQRQGAQGGFESAEELEAGSFDPLAVDRRFFFGGDGPVGLEAAEVVEADDVVELAGAAHAVDPPGEALLGEHIPAIEGVAPALAGGGEVVGRDAGDADGLEVVVEVEELGMDPDVGRIHVDEDGHVAEDADRVLGGGLAEVDSTAARRRIGAPAPGRERGHAGRRLWPGLRVGGGAGARASAVHAPVLNWRRSSA